MVNEDIKAGRILHVIDMLSNFRPLLGLLGVTVLGRVFIWLS